MAERRAPDELRSLVLQERKRFIRVGLAEILGARKPIRVVDAVATDDQLRASVARLRPNAVVLELDVPWNLKALIADLQRDVPGMRIVALHPGRVSDHGRLPSEVGIDALAPYGGGCSAIVSAVLGEPTLVGDRDAGADRRQLPSRSTLTPRECEVLLHLAQGMTAASCAAALRVSPKTIDNHKQRIFAKLRVQNQAHAVALAHRIGLLGRAPYDRAASG